MSIIITIIVLVVALLIVRLLSKNTNNAKNQNNATEYRVIRRIETQDDSGDFIEILVPTSMSNDKPLDTEEDAEELEPKEWQLIDSRILDDGTII